MARVAWRNQLIDIGRQFTEARTADARRLASELAAQGQRTTSEVSAAFDHATNGVLVALVYRLFGGRDKTRRSQSR